MRRSLFPLYLFLVIFAKLAAPAHADSRPNILVIMVDDMGFSDLGCYGGEIQTPNVDALANNGIRFRNCYNNARCNTSRFCLLTGVYASQSGLNGNIVTTIDNSVTMGEVLRLAGYHTYVSGKHHGLDNLYNRGFDRYYGLRDGASNHFNPGLQRDGEPAPGRKGFNRTWCDDALVFDTRDPAYQNYFPADFYSTDAFTGKALEYLDEWEQQDTGRPFFLYLAYTAPHDPLMAWPSDIAKYDGTYDTGFETIRAARYQKQQDIGLFNSSQYPLSAPTHQNWNSLSSAQKEDQASRMEIHAAMVDRVDQKIGEVLQKLQENGTYDNTLILFCSDNGAQRLNLSFGDSTAVMGTVGWYTALGTNWNNVSNTPFRFDKESAYNGGSRTPLIAHWPTGIKNPGRFEDKNCHFIDFMATFMELTEAEYPRTFNNEAVVPLEGESFAATFSGDGTTPRDQPIFFRWKDDRFVLSGDYKAISQNSGSSWELYNLASEGTEITNIASQNAALAAELQTTYENWESRAYQNTLPSANDDQLPGEIGSNFNIDVLSNDSDPDGNIIPGSLIISRQPLFGSASPNPDGTINYISDGSPVASDLLGYQVFDNDGQVSNEAFVTLGFAPSAPTFFTESETLFLSGASIQTTAPAASASAHINFDAATPPQYVEWTITLPETGVYSLTIAYSMGNSPRLLDLGINGDIAIDDLSFPSTDDWFTFAEIETTNFTLPAGINTIRLSTNPGDDGPNLDTLLLTPDPQGSINCGTYEAETATLSSAQVRTSQAPASGGAHVDYLASDPASYVEFDISVPEAGEYDLAIAYALGNSARVLEMSVNGTLINANLSFPSTGLWSDFHELTQNDIALNSGSNTIRFSAKANEDGPNLDALTICSSPVDSSSPGALDTDEDGLPDWFEELVLGLNSSDSSDATLDFDSDQESNLFEYLANTDPTNPISKTNFFLQPLANNSPNLQWNAFPGKTYLIRESTSLTDWSDPSPISTETNTGRFNFEISTPKRFFQLSIAEEE